MLAEAKPPYGQRSATVKRPCGTRTRKATDKRRYQVGALADEAGLLP